MSKIRNHLERVLELTDEIAEALAAAREQSLELPPLEQAINVQEITLSIDTIGMLQIWAHELAYGHKPAHSLAGEASHLQDIGPLLALIGAERASDKRAADTEEFTRKLLQPQ